MIIENVLCCKCGYIFFVEKDDKDIYECERCKQVISLKDDSCRYVINK